MDQIIFEQIKRNRTCTKKKPYAHYHIGEAVRKTIFENTNKVLRVYLCPYCGYFHLTSRLKES